MKVGYGPVWALSALGFMFLFQSCSSTRTYNFTEIPIQRELGSTPKIHLLGSSKVFDYHKGQVDFESLNIQETFNLGYFDLLKSADPRLRQLMDRIPFESSFYIILVNGQNYLDMSLWINSIKIPLNIYSENSKLFAEGHLRNWPVYSLSGLKNTKKLNQLAIDFGPSIHNLSKTQLSCARLNTPGPKGEYRNGALVLQIVNSSAMSFDTITKTAGKTAHMFAEVTIFQEDPLGLCR